MDDDYLNRGGRRGGDTGEESWWGMKKTPLTQGAPFGGCSQFGKDQRWVARESGKTQQNQALFPDLGNINVVDIGKEDRPSLRSRRDSYGPPLQGHHLPRRSLKRILLKDFLSQ